MQPMQVHNTSNMLSPARRWSSLYTIGLIILVLVFFAVHQQRHTGLFTDKFGPAEMIALYVPISISLIAPVLRAVMGKIDPARQIEFVSDICLALASIWLLIVFPFDFSHFGDVFASSLHPAFNWITDTVGRIILGLQIAISFLSVLTAIASLWRERLRDGQP
jgi:hypothetical protein